MFFIKRLNGLGMEDRTFSEMTLGSKDCCLLCSIAERYQRVSERSSTSVFIVHDDTLEGALKLKNYRSQNNVSI